MRNPIYLGVIFASIVVPAAFAQDDMSAPNTMASPEQVAPGSLIDSQGGGAIPSLPLATMTSGTIAYITGGVGDEELAELKARKAEFNVHLLMNAVEGNYISDVVVSVHDGKGTEVFKASGAGPYLYFSLPPGKYTLDATSQAGGHQVARFTVPAKGSANLHLVFKETE